VPLLKDRLNKFEVVCQEWSGVFNWPQVVMVNPRLSGGLATEMSAAMVLAILMIDMSFVCLEQSHFAGE
jgi:hypothetical protein